MVNKRQEWKKEKAKTLGDIDCYSRFSMEKGTKKIYPGG